VANKTGSAGLAVSSPWSAHPQTVKGFDVESTGVDGRVDRFDAWHLFGALGGEVGPDRDRGPAGGEFVGDPATERAVGLESSWARPVWRAQGAAVSETSPVVGSSAVASDFSGDRGWVPVDPGGDCVPSGVRILDQGVAPSQHHRPRW
jgi:hypothetical protein